MKPNTRQTELCRTEFDLIVIGAGINGAGIARDAALRGLNVLLLDKGDFGSGTSSASTRLIHGGLRYLEYGELGLVRESLREREILTRIAPHLVKPLPILLPIYQSARRGSWTIRAGMFAYDLLARLSAGSSMPGSRNLSEAAALKEAPGLQPVGLRGAALYYDAQVEFAERLVFENALAAKESGATLSTYARVDRLIIENQAVCGVEYTDVLTGDVRSALAPMTINAAGPWVDELAGAVQAPRLIGGTKGSHLIVSPFNGAPQTALYVEARRDRRPFFIIPWNANYLIGTTDLRYEGDPGEARIDADEIDYLLDETNRVIPQALLSRASILFTYSGVRPLAFAQGQGEQSITRRHFIHDHSPQISGFISIVGGKLTTYRSLAEQAVDLVFKKLRRSRPRCATAQTPLPGMEIPDDMREELSDPRTLGARFFQESGLPQSLSRRLIRVYGFRAWKILQLIKAEPSLREVFSEGTGAIAAEVVFSFQHELARTLADCLLRRTMVGLSANLGIDADVQAARVAREHLGWSHERAEEEVSAYREHVRRFQQPAPKP